MPHDVSFLLNIIFKKQYSQQALEILCAFWRGYERAPG